MSPQEIDFEYKQKPATLGSVEPAVLLNIHVCPAVCRGFNKQQFVLFKKTKNRCRTNGSTPRRISFERLGKQMVFRKLVHNIDVLFITTLMGGRNSLC